MLSPRSPLFPRCLAPLILCVAFAAPRTAAAQQPYTIAGRVVDSASQRPLANASVALTTTGARTVSGADGAFTLRASATPGSYNLQVARIGYTRILVPVRLAGDAAVNVGTVTLRPIAVALSQVVVTGTGTPTERRELGSTVTSVRGDEVNQAPAAQSVDKALQGRVVGALISQNNGQPGGGISIRLRGTGSILGGAEPLIVIDGVLVENNSEALVSLGANAGRGGAALSNSLADIAPGDVERIEVVKGAAAAALYGSRANNGVIQIFTRRGTEGAPRVTYRTEIGTGEAPGRYKLNASPTAGRGDVLFGRAPSLGAPVTRYDYQDQIFRNSSLLTNQLSVSGGSRGTSYYASALSQREDGIVRSTDLSNVNARASLTQDLSNKLRFSVNGTYIQRTTNFVPEGEQAQGVITTLIFTPTTFNPAFDANLGRYPYSPILGTNPLDVIANWRAEDNVNRFIGSVTGNWTPRADLSVNYLFGLDRSNQEFTYYQPARSTSAGFAGSIQNPTRAIQRFNNDLTVTHRAAPSASVKATTTLGFRQTSEYVNELRAAATGLSPGQTTVGAGGATPSASQGIVELRTAGGFLQERVGFADRLFLTGGVNFEGSSAFGADQRWQLFPRLGLSWSVDREPFFAGSVLRSALSGLRLRAAYGETGGQPPSAYSIFDNYVVASRAGQPALVPGAQSGNPDLKPERQREFEAGFDLAALDDRATLEFTWYDKQSTDLVLPVSLPLSSGFSTQLQNVGALSNRGVEVSLSALVLDLGRAQWNSRLSYASNRSRVKKLVTETDTLVYGYFNAVAVGQPVGVFYGAYYPRDAQGNIQVTGRLNAACAPIAGTEGLIVSRARGPGCAILRKFLGSPEPKFTLAWGNDVTLGSRVTLSTLLDGRFGNKVANFSRRISEYFGAGATSATEQCVTVGTTVYCQQTLNIERHLLYEEFVEDGGFVKLREIALRYTLDPRWVARLGTQDVTVSLAARNLHTWTNYTGIDPEINLFSANTVARGVEFGTSPIPRMIVLGLTANF